MSFKIEELSVFLPAYNEEGNVENTSKQVIKVLQKIASKWELIIVDDGSRDKTGTIADKLAGRDKHVKVVHLRPNRGYGGALKAGFATSKYSWVAFMDIDGQFDFAEISKFIDVQKQVRADMVLGVRLNRADPFVRKLFTFVWSKLLPRLLLGLRVTDYSCGFKLIRKQVYDSVLPLVGEEKVTQIEFLTKAQRRGYRFAEVGVNHFPRYSGKQTGADLKVVLRSVRDLLKLWYRLL